MTILGDFVHHVNCFFNCLKQIKPVKNLEEANNADGKIWGNRDYIQEDLEWISVDFEELANDIMLLKEDLEATEA